jgi:hypothetical protein
VESNWTNLSNFFTINVPKKRKFLGHILGDFFGQTHLLTLLVARWFIFKQKIPNGVNFGGPGNGKGWYIQRPLGIYYDNLVHFVAILVI